jgi:aspartate/methionine/tyrosine aminotransferase
LVPDLLPAGADESWIPNLRALEGLGKVPDGLLLASPANPTGVVISDEDLARICTWCEKHGVRLIMDEIYHGLTYGKSIASALQFSKSAIIINSFSKYFCMTGWRLGWMVLPDDLVDNAEKLSQNLFISASTITQLGAVAAFDCYDELDALVPHYQANRDRLCAGLPTEFLGHNAPADGAFYLYADTSALGIHSSNLAQRLLIEAGVAVTPGIDFDLSKGGQNLRLSYAGSSNDVSRAIDQIKSWLTSVK